MEAFDYVSGLSGGIIPTILYSYGQNVSTTELFDADFRLFDPSQITREALDRRNRKSIFDLLTASMFVRGVPMLFLGLLGRLYAVWTLSIWYGILHPFGIQRNKFFLPCSDKVCHKDDSISPRVGIRATPLVNYIMVGEYKDNGRERSDAYLDVIKKLREMGLVNKFTTPEQIMEAMKKAENGILIPYIASPTEVTHVYTTTFPGPSGKLFRQSSCQTQEWGGRDKPFSLEFLMAMATNVLGMGAVMEQEDSMLTKAAMATAQTRKVSFGDNEETEMMFVDGGLIDGLGVPALVKHKVRKIVAAIWPNSEDRKYAVLHEKTKGKDLVEWLSEAETVGIGDIASYFGFYQGEYGLFMNHIFEGGEYHLSQLRETMDTLYEAGKPLVTTMKDLKVIDNPFWGTEAGETVDLTIIFYTLPKSFAEKVPLDTVPPPQNKDMLDKHGSFTNEEFRHFPNLSGMSNFSTITNTWSIIRAGALTRRQSNMAAYLGSWVINEAWEGLIVNGKEVFGGFKDILESVQV